MKGEVDENERFDQRVTREEKECKGYKGKMKVRQGPEERPRGPGTGGNEGLGPDRVWLFVLVESSPLEVIGVHPGTNQSKPRLFLDPWMKQFPFTSSFYV